MEYEIENNKLQRKNNIYWNRIYINWEGKKTILIVGATNNFIDDAVGDEHEQYEWLQSIADEWIDKGSDIFTSKVHRIPFANNAHGKANVVEFINKIAE